MAADKSTEMTDQTAQHMETAAVVVPVRPARTEDLPAIERLHERAFGPGRYALTAYRVREGVLPIVPLCHVAELNGRLVAAVRLTPVEIGGEPGAALLGPLAVEPGYAGKGHGRGLIEASLAVARNEGIKLVVLVGDTSYYGRFGFAPVPNGQITFPGPVDPARILACELVDGAIAGFRGRLQSTTGDRRSRSP